MTPEDIKNGFWPTTKDAIPPLLPHLQRANARCDATCGDQINFIEPCVGAGDLVRLLEPHGLLCTWRSDISPKKCALAYKFDALDLFPKEGLSSLDEIISEADYIITNPPFSRHHEKPLREMIDRFSKVLPTWLLLPAGFAHNVRTRKSMRFCHKIVSIGRMNWIDGTKDKGHKDYAWFLFDQSIPQTTIQFFPNYGGLNGQ